MASNDAESSSNKPLAEAIAVATRSVHTKLNKLIVARLPFALPPRATDPSVYVSGLLHIAPIYIAFETLWRDLLDAAPTEEPADDPESNTARILSLLGHLRLPGLLRSDRLRADIQSITGWSDKEVEEQLTATRMTGRLAEFIRHIKRSVETKPHVLLSYSYILYMALFAGGRFIRASLESAGNDFWDQVPSPIKPGLHPCDQHHIREREAASQMSEDNIASSGQSSHASHDWPLRFFHFPTAEDGEDLRRDFKQRFSESGDRLTSLERYDVVQEAVCVFDNMALLVGQLDSLCGQADGLYDPHAKHDFAHHMHLATHPMASRLRDSVVVTKERGARLSSRNSSGDETGRSPVGNSQSEEVAGRYHLDSEKHHHAPKTGKPRTGLCPGMAKTVRFQSVSHPSRDDPTVFHGSRAEPTMFYRMVTRRIGGVQAASWILIVALGIIALWAFLTSGRGVLSFPAEVL